MGEVRISFSTGMFAVLDEDGKVVQTDYGNLDSLANIANVAVDYGRVIDKSTDDKGGLLAMSIEVPEKKLKRLTKEIQVLANKRSWLGHIGYVLGLHSAVFISTEPKTQKPLKNSQGYSAVVHGIHVHKGYYMNVTVSEDTYENKRNPHYIEDYFYLRQLEKEGTEVELPDTISEQSMTQMLDELNNMIGVPSLILKPSARNNLVRRYSGIVIGMMVRWGFKKDISNLMAIATTMAMDDKIDSKIYQSLTDAVKLAEKWGDL